MTDAAPRPRRAAPPRRPGWLVRSPGRALRIAVPAALVSALGVGAVAVTHGAEATPASVSTPSVAAVPLTADRDDRANRSQSREALDEQTLAAAEQQAAEAAEKKAAEKKAAEKKAAETKAAAKKAARTPALKVVDTEYVKAAVHVRTGADVDADSVTVLAAGTAVKVTAATRDGWRFVSYRGAGRWIKDSFLVEDKPSTTGSGGSTSALGSGSATSSAACPGGSGMESGLTSDAVLVHRSLCAAFPFITSYGGMRADSDSYHSSGRAVDAMVSGERGWQVARWVRAHASALGVSEVIYAQRIWTVQRSGEGWRAMSDRGSATANHYDHVHVSVYGNAAG